jgi:hypothetical protein
MLLPESKSFFHLSHTNKQEMLIKTVFDVQTKQPGYAVCDPHTERCGFVTYNILNAIKAGQCKSFTEVQQLINA